MSLKPPQNLSFSNTGRFDPLAYELMAEKADALGRSGRKVEKALSALSAAGASTDSELRAQLLADAVDCVFAFFVQREICGFRNQADAISRYGIPAEVMARLGVVQR